MAGQAELDDRNVGGAIAQHQRRGDVARHVLQHHQRAAGQLGNRARDIRAFVQVHLDDAYTDIAGGLDAGNVVDERGHLPLVQRQDPVLDILCAHPVVGPHDAHHRDVDLRKDVHRHAHDRARTQQADEDQHGDHRIRPLEDMFNQRHESAPDRYLDRPGKSRRSHCCTKVCSSDCSPRRESRRSSRGPRGLDHPVARESLVEVELGNAEVRRRSSRYMVGTKMSVAKVANSRPPITARASGAFCSPPSPIPSAIGIMPRIMAPAVIRTGRRRVYPADIAATKESSPASMRWLANVTTRMLLAVVSPMHISVPINAGTLRWVCVRNSIHMTPPNAKGTAISTINGSIQLWKLMTRNR